MLRILAVAALAAVTVSSASAQSIGGSYTASGTNLDGTAYEGTVEINAVSDTTCTIEWKTGSTNSEGVCMRNGNAFSAAYVQGDTLGLLVYEVKEDGSMEGIWTVTGQSGSGTEMLTPAK